MPLSESQLDWRLSRCAEAGCICEPHGDLVGWLVSVLIVRIKYNVPLPVIMGLQHSFVILANA